MTNKDTIIDKFITGVASYVKDFAKQTLVEAVDKQIEKSRPKRKTQTRKRVFRAKK
jgi:hypothetical protein